MMNFLSEKKKKRAKKSRSWNRDSQRHVGNPREMKGRNKPAFIAKQRGLAVRSAYVIEDELS